MTILSSESITMETDVSKVTVDGLYTVEALTGTDELGKTFATISEAVVTDDDFSDNGSTTTITLKTGGATFFQSVIVSE